MSLPNWIIDNRNSYNRSQWQGNGNAHEYIVVHYLGVPNADNPNLYGGGFGGHYYVSRSGQAYWSADEDQVIWHVGASSGFSLRYPNGWNPTNRNCVGIEMGVNKDNPNSTGATENDWYYSTETQETCAKLVAYLMNKLGVDINHVLRHGDITTKICPAPYFNTTPSNRYKTNWTWDEFKAKVKKYYNDTYVNKTNNTETVSNVLYTAKLPSSIYSGMPVDNRRKIATYIWEQMMKSVIDKSTNNPYYNMDLDFSFGDGLSSGSKKWQKDNSLYADGAIGYNSWKKRLDITNKTLSTIEQSGTNLVLNLVKDDVVTIKFVQSILKARGYYKMDIDGLKGNGTNKAIVDYKTKVMKKSNANTDITSDLLKDMFGGI